MKWKVIKKKKKNFETTNLSIDGSLGGASRFHENRDVRDFTIENPGKNWDNTDFSIGKLGWNCNRQKF